ncbi:MAG: 5-formyltetrahydrofolate cyclo-ligase [Sphingorhabdus sp.]
MTSLDEKSVLRRHFRTKRSRFVENLSEAEFSLAFSQLPSPLAMLCQPGKIIAGYIPVGSEANPMKLLTIAEAKGCVIALPHVISRVAPMRFLPWRTGDPLQDGPFGLKQPVGSDEVQPDIILVPMLAYDVSLMRLGQGAGHYDRALSLLEYSFAVGVAWSVQETDKLPSDPWDIPMNAILTEKSWISL